MFKILLLTFCWIIVSIFVIEIYKFIFVDDEKKKGTQKVLEDKRKVFIFYTSTIIFWPIYFLVILGYVLVQGFALNMALIKSGIDNKEEAKSGE